MTFKIRKEKGYSEYKMTPRENIAEKGIFGLAVGSIDSMLVYTVLGITAPEFLPVLAVVSFAGAGFWTMAKFTRYSLGLQNGKMYYHYKFHKNKYSNEEIVVTATNNVEAFNKYATHILLKKGYSKNELKQMDAKQLKQALEKK